MKKYFFILFFLFSCAAFAQPQAGYYIGGFAYDTTNQTCCAQFIDTSATTGVTSYMWDFGDGTPPVTTPNYTHCFAGLGDYLVCLTIHDQNGDASTFCCMFKFQQVDSAYLDCDSLIGIQDLQNVRNQLWLFPNPADENVIIKISEAGNFGLEI